MKVNEKIKERIATAEAMAANYSGDTLTKISFFVGFIRGIGRVRNDELILAVSESLIRLLGDDPLITDEKTKEIEKIIAGE